MPSSITCISAGVQYGIDRFPSITEAPYIKPYRCNLTALSHEYNHFYYASKDSIIVCQPGFPDQCLSDVPALTLRPPVSGPGLSHYMDHVTPHSINHIYVDYLGQEEILLAVCDDGDVIGYRTSAIQAALELKVAKPEDNWDPQPRTMLHRNVGMSAWGLAVHKEARLVAISANNHRITIVAFALTATPNTEKPISLSNHTSHAPGSFPHNRTEDHVFTVSANGNIPSVAFDNTGDDPSGRWLFASDIHGMTHLYDLHHRHTTSQEIHVGRCIEVDNPREDPGPTAHRGGCMCGEPGDSVMHAHWGAMFVDPRSFQHHDSYMDAFGGIPSPEIPCYWDITSSRRARRSSTNNASPSEALYSYNDIDDASDAESSQEVISNMIDGSVHTQAEGGIHSVANPAAQLTALLHDDEDMPSPGNESAVDSNSSSDDGALFTGSHGWQSSHTMRMAKRRQARKLYCQITGLGNLFLFNQVSLSPPCIIISKEEIYLLQRSHSVHTLTDFRPIISIHNPLYHENEGYDEKDAWTQRQNLFAQIPELGIFIVGANAGRCAVYSLTQVKTIATGSAPEGTVYGFRQDFILPFHEQETNGHAVPKHEFLAGIAVGPIQGSLNSERLLNDDTLENRRWRIILLFSEHTVLSYEIGRKREPGSLALGDLMV